MRIVDLSDINTYKSVAKEYIKVPQPMYICYSNEELFENFKPRKIINNIQELMEFMKEEKLMERNEIHFLKDAWIDTHEKFRPCLWTQSDQIIYELNGSKLIPTDSCYVQLCSIRGMGNWVLLATSSGLYKASIVEWNVSAALKPQFYKINNSNRASKEKAERARDKMLNRKSATTADLRFVHYLINPASQAYGNEEEASKLAYRTVNKETRKQIVQQPRIRQLIIKEIKMLYPDFAEELRKEITVKDHVAPHMKKMLEQSISKGTTQDQIDALDVILKNVYSQPEVRYDSPSSPIPLVGDKKDPAAIAEHNRKMIEDGNFSGVVIPDRDPQKEVKKKKEKPEKDLYEEYQVPRQEDDEEGLPFTRDINE